MRRPQPSKVPAAVAMAMLILMGCPVMQGRQPASAVANDAAGTAKVPSCCVADPVVRASALHGETPAGVVSLTGFVDRDQEQRRAIP